MSATYFVSHGCAAALSCCTDATGLQPARGEAVVIRSTRGPELGTVLTEVPDDVPIPFSTGELLRRATADDHRSFAELRRRGQLLLDDAHRLVEEQRLPLLPLDVDLTLDGAEAQIHVLRWEPCTLTPLLEELRRRHPFAVQLLDTSHHEEEHHGCGSCGSCGDGGCGSCGSGCGKGDCSRGAAPSAAELTAYFAALRAQMEAMQRVPLL
jgi:hypothetical protein